jgi:starch-binding outer membrane protein, SusD/RagB family
MKRNPVTTRPRGASRSPRRRPGLALAAVAPLATAACDPSELLQVDDPDVILPGDVEGPTTLPAVLANAIGDFAVAYSGNPAASGGEAQILISGMIADEFIHTGTFDTREIIDRRIVSELNPHVEGTFRLLHRARTSAERATELFASYGANTANHAEVQSLAGFTYVMFAENYCSGVPFSRIAADGSLEYGSPQTTSQTFQHAIDRFDGALAAATAAGSAQQQHLARLGRARALLGLGQYAAAAAEAADVPTSFFYEVFHSESSTRQNNGVWTFNNSAGRWSVADNEGGNGLPFRSAGDVDGGVQDPRIPSEQIGLAQRTGLRALGEHWGQLKMPERSSGTVLATGVEARLIEAEAALRGGPTGVPAFVSLHSALRTSVGLPALNLVQVTAMTQAQREDLHFQERAYWLWLTSRRLGDLRRMMWDYGRDQADIFPVGNHHRAGLPYGTDTNIPIPFDEQNNPNFNECLDRGA